MENAAVRRVDFDFKEAAPRQLSLRQKMLVLLGAAVGLASGFGPVFFGAAGIFLKPMAISFHWNRADAAMLPMLGLVGAAIGALLIGSIANRTGWNRLTAFSIMLFPLGLLTLSVAPANHAFVASIALLTGIVGVGTTALGYIAILSRVFDRRLGMALGFMMIGHGVGTTAVPIVAGKLLEVMDWRQAYACFAGISLLLGVVAHRLVFRVLDDTQTESGARKGKAADSSAPQAIAPAGDGLSLRQAIASYRFWLIGVVVMVVSGTTLGGFIHLASYASDRGIGSAVAAQSAGLVGFGVAVTRVATGFILDKVFAPLVAFVAILLGALGFYLLTTDIVQSVWILSLAAILIGVSSGAEGDIIPFLARKYFGIRAFGSIYGALFAIATIGGALGPYIYGLSFDRFKSYMPILQASALLCCICGLAILMLGRYRFAASRDEKAFPPCLKPGQDIS